MEVTRRALCHFRSRRAPVVEPPRGGPTQWRTVRCQGSHRYAGPKLRRARAEESVPMRRLLPTFLLALVMTTGAVLPAAAQSASDLRLLSVTATASIRAVPDRAVIQL